MNEAYEVISDPQKRAQYDQYGQQWKEAGGFANGAGENSGFNGAGDLVILSLILILAHLVVAMVALVASSKIFLDEAEADNAITHLALMVQMGMQIMAM